MAIEIKKSVFICKHIVFASQHCSSLVIDWLTRSRCGKAWSLLVLPGAIWNPTQHPCNRLLLPVGKLLLANKGDPAWPQRLYKQQLAWHPHSCVNVLAFSGWLLFSRNWAEMAQVVLSLTKVILAHFSLVHFVYISNVRREEEWKLY